MESRTKYYKLIKQHSNHEVGRIYYVVEQHDGTLYSGDYRGLGQGGYVSNVIDTYFELSSKEEYEKQKL